MADVDMIHEIDPARLGRRATAACPACKGRSLVYFYQLAKEPTNSCILVEDEASALAFPTGAIDLAMCENCGFIHNAAFDEKMTEYDARYEATQGFSPTFSKFHQRLCEGLIEKHDLKGKTVLEIGCGEGEFVVMMAEMAGATAIGVDPVCKERIESDAADRITFIKEFYDADKHRIDPVHFVACKMTLEHIPNVKEFLSEIRRGLGDQRDAVVFFQIPEALRILRETAFEDIFYEHCSYFTPGSLARAFREAGFDVHELTLEFGAQYHTIEAKVAALDPADRPAPLPLEDDLEEIKSLVATFQERVRPKMDQWRSLVRDAVAAGEKVVIWGSGSKAVAFMAALGVTDAIDSVVDVNPHKRGFYMPGGPQKIVGPADLPEIRPDLVIVMNRIYENEIRADLEKLGLSPRLVRL